MFRQNEITSYTYVYGFLGFVRKTTSVSHRRSRLRKLLGLVFIQLYYTLKRVEETIAFTGLPNSLTAVIIPTIFLKLAY